MHVPWFQPACGLGDSGRLEHGSPLSRGAHEHVDDCVVDMLERSSAVSGGKGGGEGGCGGDGEGGSGDGGGGGTLGGRMMLGTYGGGKGGNVGGGGGIVWNSLAEATGAGEQLEEEAQPEVWQGMV